MEVGPSRCAEIRTTPADHFQLPCPKVDRGHSQHRRYSRSIAGRLLISIKGVQFAILDPNAYPCRMRSTHSLCHPTSGKIVPATPAWLVADTVNGLSATKARPGDDRRA